MVNGHRVSVKTSASFRALTDRVRAIAHKHPEAKAHYEAMRAHAKSGGADEAALVQKATKLLAGKHTPTAPKPSAAPSTAATPSAPKAVAPSPAPAKKPLDMRSLLAAAFAPHKAREVEQALKKEEQTRAQLKARGIGLGGVRQRDKR